MALKDHQGSADVEQCDEVNEPGSTEYFTEGHATYERLAPKGNTTLLDKDDADSLLCFQNTIDPLLFLPPAGFCAWSEEFRQFLKEGSIQYKVFDALNVGLCKREEGSRIHREGRCSAESRETQKAQAHSEQNEKDQCATLPCPGAKDVSPRRMKPTTKENVLEEKAAELTDGPYAPGISHPTP